MSNSPLREVLGESDRAGEERRTQFRWKRTGKTLQLRLEEERGGRVFQAEGNSQSKGPETEVCLVCLGNMEGLVWLKQKVWAEMRVRVWADGQVSGPSGL